MKIVGVTGTKDSGKTVLVEKLVEGLAGEGYRTATLKHSHVGFDFPGRDTDRHRKAGAEIVVGAGRETFFLLERELDLEEIVAVIDVLDGVDFLIVEGFKSMEYANFSTSTPNEFTLKVVDPFKLEDVDELIDLIKRRSYGLLQGLDCGKCGFKSCSEFAASKVRGYADEVDCRSQPEKALLRINGRPVPMNPFVQEFISKTVLGMVDALDTENLKIEKVDLIIKVQRNR
ncbi:molybdopterin-guanine dinucleotide biosynthesis protein B [Methanothermobacter wolfeii]|uniref:Molybdopterin-guanine dinucleotide biosynthesis protein B n=1 Tax=Methanothermobacter wolfeii TaxID=145261 RepID=A0A9E7RV15_METWO|nr:molybdopterin-guanine dinucleotide biosynthesis protein B [Methanothermobacter wolfeii]MDI6701850.1 molybdopterin-guanine dinucleotide biosynthesis protein B [Methanothermobacter wolfeii]MDI6841295.1 molybdopterin-guanine dinucleotide biosynthesis protein B [Methanothermobacter wolfeii]NLM02954.1 molybdopterin-guanine dinucleotide biosynthesis protein B [Methanothermobacter wolfeii]UXH31828.1 molybdopterin-guanine dinucleotide biosynthesis protein B [Methanothermobacter wolfeii]SCM55664.1 M